MRDQDEVSSTRSHAHERARSSTTSSNAAPTPHRRCVAATTSPASRAYRPGRPKWRLADTAAIRPRFGPSRRPRLPRTRYGAMLVSTALASSTESSWPHWVNNGISADPSSIRAVRINTWGLSQAPSEDIVVVRVDHAHSPGRHDSSHSIGKWFTPRTFRRTVATLVTDALPAREASDMLGHSRVSQTTDTYVGRMVPSRNPADVLEVLGSAKNGSLTEADQPREDHDV